MNINVVYFQRKPLPIHKSIEAIFDDIRGRMPSYITCCTVVFRNYSRGLLNRLCIMWEAFKNQGEINHITGDIHFAAILLTKRNTMLTIHDCRMLSDTKGLKHLVFKTFWFTLPLKKCAIVTVVSEATKNELLRFVDYPKDNIRVIPNAISGSFTYHKKDFNSVKPVLLQVGTTINKNIDRLLDAIIGIECHLNIIGQLSEEHYKKLTENKIDYTNSQQLSERQLIQQYINCDIVTFISTYEGFGMPIIEANTVGRPVISSSILSMPEVAANAALLVDPYSVSEIRNGIIKIISDKAFRDRLVKNGIENCKRFDPLGITNSYLDCYKILCGEFQGNEKEAT